MLRLQAKPSYSPIILVLARGCTEILPGREGVAESQTSQRRFGETLRRTRVRGKRELHLLDAQNEKRKRAGEGANKRQLKDLAGAERLQAKLGGL